jgi:hypothetical protein
MLGAVSGAKTIGRYFTVVSFLPSVPFVAYVVLLVRSGAWGGSVHFGQALAKVDAVDGLFLAIGSLVFAMAVHPLQFAIVQAFEGYWGDSGPAARVATWRIQRHRKLCHRLDKRAANLDDSYGTGAHPVSKIGAPRIEVAQLVQAVESSRRRTFYPADLEMIMPTLLGNVLRRYEIEVGRAYGLDCLTVLPRIMQRADQRDIDYVQNQRTQLDLAVRTAALSMAACLLTLVFMLNHLWLLLTFIPLGLAWAAYRGAVRVAHEYGMALAVLVEYNRFTLYEQMHMQLPNGLEAERELNGHLIPLLGLDPEDRGRDPDSRTIEYQHPDPGSTPATDPAPSTGQTPTSGAGSVAPD